MAASSISKEAWPNSSSPLLLMDSEWPEAIIYARAKVSTSAEANNSMDLRAALEFDGSRVPTSRLASLPSPLTNRCRLWVYP